MDTHIYDIQIRVLISKEDGEFIARALEMDLLGYGKTEKDAVEELKHAVESQISFARQMNDNSLIPFPADAEYFKRWDAAQRAVLESVVHGDKSLKLAAKAVVISLKPSDLKSVKAREFVKQDLVCA
jgi:hypothetical protein